MDKKIREPYEPWYYRTMNFDNMQIAAIESVWVLGNSAKNKAEALRHTFNIINSLRMTDLPDGVNGPACAVNFWSEEMPNLQNYNAREHFKGFPVEVK